MTPLREAKPVKMSTAYAGHPLRRIVSRERIEGKLGLTRCVIMELACGHEARAKLSREPKGDMVRCWECKKEEGK